MVRGDVSLMPTLMLAIPFNVLAIFTFKISPVEFCAADYPGTGVASATTTKRGPEVTVLAIAVPGATAMCADLGARTIRDRSSLRGDRSHGRYPFPLAPRASTVRRTSGGALLPSSSPHPIGLARFFCLLGVLSPCYAGLVRRRFRRSSPDTAYVFIVAGQGGAVRVLRGPGLIVWPQQGHSGRRRPRWRGQRCQRNSCLHVHGAFRDKYHRDRGRCEGDTVITLPTSAPSKLNPRTRRFIQGRMNGLIRIGNQAHFYFRTLSSIRDAFLHYKVEMVRLIAQMSLGSGALAIVGGTVVIVGFLTLATGALIAVDGYNEFANVGVEALTGFASAYFNVRLIHR